MIIAALLSIIASILNITGVIAITGGIISIAAYFLYIRLLGKAKNMLAE